MALLYAVAILICLSLSSATENGDMCDKNIYLTQETVPFEKMSHESKALVVATVKSLDMGSHSAIIEFRCKYKGDIPEDTLRLDNVSEDGCPSVTLAVGETYLLFIKEETKGGSKHFRLSYSPLPADLVTEITILCNLDLKRYRNTSREVCPDPEPDCIEYVEPTKPTTKTPPEPETKPSEVVVEGQSSGGNTGSETGDGGNSATVHHQSIILSCLSFLMVFYML